MAYQVYWQGADGNIYLRSGDQVQNAGKAISTGDNGFDAQGMSAEAVRIADPNPPKQTAPNSPNGGGATGPQREDRSNSIALQLAGLGAVDQQYNSGISAIDRALGSLRGQYDSETGRNEGLYRTSSDTNQNNLQKNKQTALVNAAQGRQGLMGTLSSIGALSGDGLTLANRAVQKGANEDLSGAADNFSENQSGLDTSINTYRDEDARRRKQAEDAAGNAKTKAAGDAAKSRMEFYSNLSTDYAKQLDAGQAAEYARKAAALYPELAKSNIPDTNIGYQGAAFTPTTLANYMAGADSTQVAATPTAGGQMPGLVASPTKKKQLQATLGL